MNLQNPLVKISLVLIGAALIISGAIFAYIHTVSTPVKIETSPQTTTTTENNIQPAEIANDPPATITINKPQPETGVQLQENTNVASEEDEEFKNIDSAHDYVNFEKLIQEIGENTQGESTHGKK